VGNIKMRASSQQRQFSVPISTGHLNKTAFRSSMVRRT
jgi:hypothetical protein